MSDINTVTMIGRLTKDPEQRQLQTGTSLANFTLASSSTYTKATGEKVEDTIFITCTVWGKQAEAIMKYTNKGKQLCVQGKLKQSSWQDPEGRRVSKIEINVSNFQFLGGKSSQPVSQDINSNGVVDRTTINDGDLVEPSFSDDDIPF